MMPPSIICVTCRRCAERRSLDVVTTGAEFDGLCKVCGAPVDVAGEAFETKRGIRVQTELGDPDLDESGNAVVWIERDARIVLTADECKMLALELIWFAEYLAARFPGGGS